MATDVAIRTMNAMSNSPVIGYVRLKRESTRSWMTFQLPKKMKADDAVTFLQAIMPDWTLICGCLENPDNLPLGDKIRKAAGYQDQDDDERLFGGIDM